MQISCDRRAVLAAGARVVGGVSALGPLGECLAAPKKTLGFPQDHRVHPGFPWETWQLAGYANDGSQGVGFQVTFFRSMADGVQRWHAHASVTDVSNTRFLHDQRVNRTGANGTGAPAKLSVADWSLGIDTRDIEATVKSDAFEFALRMTPRQPVLLHGEEGHLRQGLGNDQLSYQYSLPQCAVQGSLFLQGRRLKVQGDAWLGHEWSQNPPGQQAAGRDCFAMNLFDGSFVQAFQVRDKSGDRLWDGGVFRTGKGQRFEFRRGTVEFRRQRSWKSLLTQAHYPVEWIVRTPADFYTVRAVFPHQELDSRPATSGVYWKGLSDLLDSNGNHIGRGFLEMTGYAQTKSL